MAGRSPGRIPLDRFLPALLASFLTGCTLEQFPQSTLSPRSEYAAMIQRLLEQQVLWVVIIFTLVMAAILFIVMKFRARPGAPEPKHIHGHTGLEIAWTIAPAVILTLIAIPTVATIYHTQAPAPPNSLVVRAIGHQWWWEFQYPDLGVTTATDMVVPVGRTVSVHIETVDVLHSFWFPAMGGKRDAVPGRVNKIFFTPDRPGEFPGQCAELCGVSHANMRMRLYVRTPEEFDAWVAAQKSGPLEPEPGSLAATGKQTFQTGACIACHTVTGVAAGVIGPNLTHVASRSSIAGGIYPNDAEHLGHWITDPPSRKPGSLMPKMPMTPDQVQALVAYITSLK